MHRHHKDLRKGGKALDQAKKAIVMVHGRGASAESIMSLSEYLDLEDFALLAPQANQHTWYPYSFMAPSERNEPGLSTGLAVINETVEEIKAAGINEENIYFLGFSQGACLVSEYVGRNAKQYGGVFILSGGVIGAEFDRSKYDGNFKGSPIYLGCSDKDAHVPLSRVKESTALFEELGANMTEQIFPNAPHTVLQEEIDAVNEILKG